MERYEKLRGRLSTGSIVLFSGKGGVSAGIKWATGSKWSHVGLVVNSLELNTVLLWESTTLSSLKDLDTGVAREGVQIVPLSERLKGYRGSASVRVLSPGRQDWEVVALGKLRRLRRELRGRPYEESRLELLRAAYDGPWGENVEDLSSLFCSELVAESYQELGLLPTSPPSNEYTPQDFSAEVAIDLLGGARLSREYRIK